MARAVKGKTAIVTGAGSGINLEFARLLLQDGANVLFADLALRPEAEKLVSQYQSNPKAVFQKTDVTSWADLSRMFNAAQDHFGSVDIVCPGAGIFEPPFSNFWHPPGTSLSKDDPIGDRYMTLDINLTHPIRLTQMAISHFLSTSPPSSSSNPKTIVHIASIAAQATSLLFPLYHASKHGLQGFVRSMEVLEHLHGIRVVAVDPGVVKTPLWLDNPDKLRIVKNEGENPDTWVTPEEVATVMLATVTKDQVSSGKLGKEETIEIKGGTCLEILAGYVRDVPAYNNPGPQASGHPGASVTHAEKIYEEIVDSLKPGWGVSK